MNFQVGDFAVLLVGPRVSRLQPFLSSRGIRCGAQPQGRAALATLQSTPCHLVLFELELEDMLGAEFLELSRRDRLASSYILLEDVMKSGMIVSLLSRGIDGFVPVPPPDEDTLLNAISRQLLLLWAAPLAASGPPKAAEPSSEALDRVKRDLALEKRKVTELVKEIASLREEAAAARTQNAKQLSTSSPSRPDKTAVPHKPAPPAAVETKKPSKTLLDDEEGTVRIPSAGVLGLRSARDTAAAQTVPLELQRTKETRRPPATLDVPLVNVTDPDEEATAFVPYVVDQPPAVVNDQKTAPRGLAVPASVRDDFADPPPTSPSYAAAARPAALDDDDSASLFLDPDLDLGDDDLGLDLDDDEESFDDRTETKRRDEDLFLIEED
jgi:DNA-binding NarL/FixJ family response regulator